MRLEPNAQFLTICYRRFVFCRPFSLVYPPAYVIATGGAFPYTKHGGGTTDGATPCAGGVNRGLGDDYIGNCDTAQYNPTNTDAGTYQSGSAPTATSRTQASERVSQNQTQATMPVPDPYLAMKDYGGSSQTTQNYANLCWYCHENITNINLSGSPLSMGRWSFYQGKIVYQDSSHYNSANFYWPGVSDITPVWPRQSRISLPSGNKGSCLNCHTPHGIKGSFTNAYDTAAVPASMQTVASGNPSVSQDYLIPRQLIAWEEALCFNCHDNDPAINIKSDIEKRSLVGGSGHPVNDTGLAGRHVASEPLPITTKHVECYDCHNPHAVKAPTGTLGDGDGGRVRGMKYVDINGTVRSPATLGGTREPYIYEVCLKCHGNTWDQVFSGSGKLFPTETIYRPPGMSNKRLEFDSTSSDATYGPPGTNNAYHPVASAGKNTSLALCLQLQAGGFPGLTCTTQPSPDLASLTIMCTDCHNSEQTGGTVTALMGPVTESNLRSTDKASVYIGTSPVGSAWLSDNNPISQV